MQKWEYMLVGVPTEIKNGERTLTLVSLGPSPLQPMKLEDYLNTLGSDGWELAGVEGYGQFVFKRTKP
jgi:hypothetical protein